MNQVLEDAVVSNLSATFPTATIFTGKVVQGVEADNIIVKTILDDLEVLGTGVRNRTTMVQVSVISPTTEENQLKDLLFNSLMSFTLNGEVFEVDTINFASVDDILHTTFTISYREVIK